MALPAFARLLATSAALAGLATAGVWSVRIGWADFLYRQATVPATEAACSLLPDNARYLAQLANLISDDQPRRAQEALRSAIALNPWDSRAWIDLGLRAERAGDEAAAKSYLLRAAAVDREYQPRWTLANHCYRHGDEAGFWRWAQEAAAMATRDVQPLFRLCGRVREDGQLIERLSIRNPDVRSDYLAYLLAQNRPELIGDAVRRLLEEHRQVDAPLLLTACDRLLEAAHVDQAAELWDQLAREESVPSRRAGELLTNADFEVPPISRGFDWRLPAPGGITVSREEAGGLEFAFSGNEPEDGEVLGQFIPVREKSSYWLRFSWDASGDLSGEGLEWRITDAVGTHLRGGSALKAADGQLEFDTPAGCRLVRLSLWYHRALGTTRLKGAVVLRKVSVQAASQTPSTKG